MNNTVNDDQLDLLFEVIEDLYSEETRKIAEYLLNIDEIAEDVLSEQMGIKLPHIRKELYKLNDISLTKSRRTTDPKTRWHTIHWKLIPNNTINLLRRIKLELEEKQINLNNLKSNSFFKCANEADKVSYETAMLQNFLCNECGEQLEAYDDSADIDELISRIEILENFLHNLHRE